MPKFGKAWFNGYYFGDDTPSFTNFYNSIHRIPLGMEVRKQLAKSIIFRVRRGNGHAGSTAGRRYQDKYKYFVPSSINNVESDPYRTNWKTAIDYWQNILSTAEKAEYNRRAKKGLRMSGYNLFIREAMRGVYKMFVDRGDPATYDFTDTDLTIDGDWHVLDLSSIVPTTARLLLLKTSLKSGDPGDAIRYRKVGNSNEINACECEALRANVTRTRLGTVAIDNSQTIEYNADNISWTEMQIVVRGWWT